MTEIVSEVRASVISEQTERGEAVVYSGENTAEAARQAGLAEGWATRAEAAAALANYFTSRALGAAGTATDRLFSSDEEGDLAIYRRTGTAPNYLFLEWAGTPAPFGTVPAVPVDEAEDCAVAINLELQKSHVNGIVLPARVVGLSRAISIPSGKFLRGQGNRTILRPLAGFDRSLGSSLVITDITLNGSILSSALYQWTYDVLVEDLLCDVDKYAMGLGDAYRINGVNLYLTTRSGARRVRVTDATGYGVHHAGKEAATEGATQFASGFVDHCYVSGANVGFEAQNAENVIYTACEFDDGDATITPEGQFHPFRARDITYIGCRGRGRAIGLYVVPATSGGVAQFPTRRIKAHGCDMESVSSAIVTGFGGVEDLDIVGGRYESSANIGAQLTDTRIALDGGVKIYGVPIGIQGDATTILDANGAYAKGTSSGASDAYGLASSSSGDRWNGGTLEADATGSGGEHPYSGPVVVSAATKLIPAATVAAEPVIAALVLTANAGSSNAGTTPAIVGSADAATTWSVAVESGKIYEIEFGASWIMGANGQTGKFGLKGSGGAAGTVNGWITMQDGASARVDTVIYNLSGIGTAGGYASQVQASISAYGRSRGKFGFRCSASGTVSIEFAAGGGGENIAVLGADTFRVTAK